MLGANVLVMFLIDFLEQARVTSKQIAVERNLNFKGGLRSERFKQFFFLFKCICKSELKLELCKC